MREISIDVFGEVCLNKFGPGKSIGRWRKVINPKAMEAESIYFLNEEDGDYTIMSKLNESFEDGLIHENYGKSGVDDNDEGLLIWRTKKNSR